LPPLVEVDGMQLGPGDPKHLRHDQRVDLVRVAAGTGHLIEKTPHAPVAISERITDGNVATRGRPPEHGAIADQHRNVIDAASAAGVSHIAYTSVLNADRAKLRLAADHLATEHALAEAGVPFTLLRNSWYLENHTDTLAATLELGAVLGSAGEGRVAAATRADFAKAAAVLTTDGHGGVYELGSDTPFTLAELAQAITDASGVTVAYHDLPPADFAKALITAELPQPVAELLADSDLGIARGDLTTDRHDLSALIGAPTTTMPDAIRAALAIVT
jgi:NAD(P)H dehydrogenase (quinone)